MAERVVNLAEAVVLKKETQIVNELAKKAEGDNAPQYAVDNLFDELMRQSPKGKWDEEEQMVGNLEQKKGKKKK